MAEPLTVDKIGAIIFLIAVGFLIFPSFIKLVAQAVPFIADVISDIFEDWLEAWREAAAEIKKIFKGENDARG